MIYRLPHVTTLEKFRRVLAADDSNTWDTEASLLDSLTGAFIGNDKTAIGTAFHKLVEDGKAERTEIIGGNTYHLACGYAFTEEQAEVAFTYKREHPLMFCEVPVAKLYHTPLASFYLSGRIDGLDGATVRDTKTKFSSPDAQGYLDSYQWRFYLDMLGLKSFCYDVFEVKSYPKAGINVPAPGTISILDGLKFVPYGEIKCFSYPTMQRDLYELLSAFADWLDSRNLWHLLSPCDTN